MKKLTVLLGLLLFLPCACSPKTPVEPDIPDTPPVDSVPVDEEPTVDLLAEMTSAKAEHFPDLYGNATAEELAAALNGAVEHRITGEEAVAAGYHRAGMMAWSIYDAFYYPEPDSDGTMRFFMTCTPAEDIVEVAFYDHTASETGYFKDETLYQLVRCYGDFDEYVDEKVYAQQQDFITPIMAAELAEGNEYYGGQFTGYQLLRLAESYAYTEDTGAEVVLYDFNFCLLTEEPEAVGGMGGMYFDSQYRLCNSSPYNFLVVRYVDGQPVRQAITSDRGMFALDTPELRAEAEALITRQMNTDREIF